MDHTKTNTFAGFVNIEKNNKFWVDGGFMYCEDTPSLFKFNTKEEKAIVQNVAQSYIDNWGFEAVELVIFEIKSRHIVNLKKRSEQERKAAQEKMVEEANTWRNSEKANEINEASPKKRGRKPKSDATI